MEGAFSKIITSGAISGLFVMVYFVLFWYKVNKLKNNVKTVLYYSYHSIFAVGCLISLVVLEDVFGEYDWTYDDCLIVLLPFTLFLIPTYIVFRMYLFQHKMREEARLIRESTSQKNNISKTQPIFYVAFILTVIAVLFFVYFEYNLLYDPIGRTDKFGTHVLNFFICFALPIILWIANAIISNNDLNNKVTSKVNKEMKSIYGSNYGQTSAQKKASNERIRTEARKRLREAKSDFEEGFLTHAEYKKILDENKPKIL